MSRNWILEFGESAIIREPYETKRDALRKAREWALKLPDDPLYVVRRSDNVRILRVIVRDERLNVEILHNSRRGRRPCQCWTERVDELLVSKGFTWRKAAEARAALFSIVKSAIASGEPVETPLGVFRTVSGTTRKQAPRAARDLRSTPVAAPS